MDLTKLQLSELMCKTQAKGNGLHDLMEIMIESMMVAERGEFLADNPGNKGMAIVPAPLMAQGRKLELSVSSRTLAYGQLPSAKYSPHTPRPEEECDRLAGVSLYKGAY